MLPGNDFSKCASQFDNLDNFRNTFKWGEIILNMYAVSFQIFYALNILMIERLLENAHVSCVTRGY